MRNGRARFNGTGMRNEEMSDEEWPSAMAGIPLGHSSSLIPHPYFSPPYHFFSVPSPTFPCGV